MEFMKFLDAEFVQGFIRMADDGWQQGWHAHLALSHLCDEQIGRIRSTLSSCGLADNTMVVFTADHGEHMGQHGMYQKMEMYEPAVRVPAIFHLPGTPSCRLKSPEG